MLIFVEGNFFKLHVQNPCIDCPCVGERPTDLEEGEEGVRMIIPYATNGEMFPWNNQRLPTFARPSRYHISIHPNLTTMDVKGMYRT